MAEAFSNSLTRAVGIVTTSTSASIGITTNKITGISTIGIAVSSFIDNSNFIAGTKVSLIAASQVVLDRDSTNEAAVSSQTVNTLGVTTVYTSPAATKSILIGGTFANNTTSPINLTVEVYDQSTTVGVAIATKIPVPAGSSFVISDTGKTLLEANDEIRVYTDSSNAIDVNLSILTGVS
tara:strand:- start:1137 stop:1676 length:540 start_codon:yes stop_codon:yes gene_type:complete